MAAKKHEYCCPPAPAVTPYPWLVYSHGADSKSQTFCDIKKPNEFHLRRIPELQGKEFWASCHGWSLFSDRDRIQIFVWNPVTMEKIRLPPLNFKGSIRQCTFSSHPSGSPGCMILLVACDLPLIVFHQLGNKQWTELNYKEELDKCFKDSGELVQRDDEDDGDDGFKRCYHRLRIISCNGNLYAETDFLELFLTMKLKPDGVVLTYSRLRFPRAVNCAEYMRTSMVEFQGQIYKIVSGFKGIDYDEVVAVEIFRLDLSEMIVEKVEHVPDLVFFLDDYGSFCCHAIDPETHGNRIYFSVNRNLYSYNIEDRTLSVYRALSHIKSPYFSFWIMPDQRSTNMAEQAKVRSIMVGEEYWKVQVERKDQSNVVLGKGGIGKEGTMLCDLPLDIAAEIVGRLILVDYLHLRSTCRMYRSISPRIDWKKALKGLGIPCLSPWLIFLEKDCVCSLADPRHGDKYLINIPPLLSGCDLCHSKNGWLLLSANTASTFLFNPFTKQIVPFPTVSDRRGTSAYYIGFSCNPTSSDCLVVVIDQYSSSKFGLSFARPGGETWVAIENINLEVDFTFTNNSPVFYEGAFYCLGHGGNLGVLEIRDDDEVTWNVLPKPTRPCSSYKQNFLMECDGELLSVFVGEFGKWVRVFRLNRSSMAWVKVKSLGNFMIFISRSSSLAAMATTPGMENKIYFPRFRGQSGHDVVFYSLDTNKFHSFEGKDSEVDFYTTREQLGACWIEPNWC